MTLTKNMLAALERIKAGDTDIHDRTLAALRRRELVTGCLDPLALTDRGRALVGVKQPCRPRPKGSSVAYHALADSEAALSTMWTDGQWAKVRVMSRYSIGVLMVGRDYDEYRIRYFKFHTMLPDHPAAPTETTRGVPAPTKTKRAAWEAALKWQGFPVNALDHYLEHMP